jgi:hypothetical protein
MTKAPLTNSLATSPVSVSDTNGLRDIVGPRPIPSGLEWLWWTLAILAVLAAALALFLWARRRRLASRAAPPPIPPHERALQRLEAALRLLDEPEPFVVEVSNTARVYLEERFDLHAPERTTEEFLHEVTESPALLPEQKESLGRFLESCDLVKFARYEPHQQELRGLHEAAVRLVVETKPAPHPDGGATQVLQAG